jgi:hypothetical protein
MRFKTAILSCGFLTGLSVSLAVGVIAQQWATDAPAGIAWPARAGNPGAGIVSNERAHRSGERFEQDRAVSAEPHPRFRSAGSRFRSEPSGEACDYAGTRLKMTEQQHSEEERERLAQLEADLADINRSTMMRELALAMARETTQPASDSSRAKTPVQLWLVLDLRLAYPGPRDQTQMISRTHLQH